MLHIVAPMIFGTITFVSAPVQEFDTTWGVVESAIRNRYYARVSRKDEMEKLLQEFGPKAKAAKSRTEFSNHVNAMIDRFGDSHFDFFTTEDQGFFAMNSLLPAGGVKLMPHIGAWFKPGADGYTLSMVMEGGPAANAGLRKNDTLVSVNGAPFSPVQSLQPHVGKTVQVKYRRNNALLAADVAVASSSAIDMFLQGSRESSKVIDYKGKKIGYFHLWTMANDNFRNALSGAVLGELKDTDAMIFDIRDGFGGRPEGFADPFFRPDVELVWKFSETNLLRQKMGYGQPVVLLINEGSRSAKEVVSHIFKKSKRATLIGRTTAGHVLGTSPMPVHDWAYLEIPMVELTADGKRLEGVGVAPDIEVKGEFDAAGNDVFIQTALEYLTK